MSNRKPLTARIAEIRERTDIDDEAKGRLVSIEIERDQRIYRSARAEWTSSAYLAAWMTPLIETMHRWSVDEPHTPPVTASWLGQRVLEALWVEMHGTREDQDELLAIWRSMGITT